MKTSMIVALLVNISQLLVKYIDRYIMSMIVAYPINIFQLSIKWQQTLFVYEDVGDCGIVSKYLSTLGQMATNVIPMKTSVIVAL